MSSAIYCILRGGAAAGPLTCSAYERDVRACLAFLRERRTDDLARVRPPDLRAFLAKEAKRRPAIGTQARTIAALKCFFRFLVENEYPDRDPARVLRTPKNREALPDVLDWREVARLLAVVGRDCVWGVSSGGSASATGCCSSSSPTRDFARASFSGSTGTTSTSNGGCSG